MAFLKFLIPYYTPISSDETDFNAVKFVRELQSGDVHSFMERHEIILCRHSLRIEHKSTRTSLSGYLFISSLS